MKKRVIDKKGREKCEGILDVEMENKMIQVMEGLNKKVDSLSDQAETSVNKFNKLSDELQEQNQILKRLLLLAEASADAHSKMILELEEINSELKPKPQPKHDGIGMNDQKLMAFISRRAREAKYDPDSDPVLQAFKKRLRLR